MDKSNQGHNFQVRELVELSVLACLSFVLMFIAFPIIPLAPFLTIDFSALPILLGTIMFGPAGGIIIAGLKSLLYWFVTGASIPNLIGVAASLISSITLITAYWLTRKAFLNSKTRHFFTIVLSMTISLTIVMSLLNWLFVLPAYMSVLGMHLGIPLNQLILLGVVPFNLIKGAVVGVLFLLAADRLKGRLEIK